MNKSQRFRYEMFVRVRDFGAARQELFPESSRSGEAFKRVAAAVAAIEEHRKDHVVGTAEARRVKAATRAAVFNYMKTVALAARRVTRPDASENPFIVPRQRNLERELATARAFIEAAEARQTEFVSFGLPPLFISDFRKLVDTLQQAFDLRLGSKTVRREAIAGTRMAITRGLEAVHDLDALVTIATLDDGATHRGSGVVGRLTEAVAARGGAGSSCPGGAGEGVVTCVARR